MERCWSIECWSSSCRPKTYRLARPFAQYFTLWWKLILVFWRASIHTSVQCSCNLLQIPDCKKELRNRNGFNLYRVTCLSRPKIQLLAVACLAWGYFKIPWQREFEHTYIELKVSTLPAILCILNLQPSVHNRHRPQPADHNWTQKTQKHPQPLLDIFVLIPASTPDK